MGLENHLCSLETLIININGKKSQDFKCIVQMLISIVIDNAEADD